MLLTAAIDPLCYFCSVSPPYQTSQGRGWLSYFLPDIFSFMGNNKTPFVKDGNSEDKCGIINNGVKCLKTLKKKKQTSNCLLVSSKSIIQGTKDTLLLQIPRTGPGFSFSMTFGNQHNLN